MTLNNTHQFDTAAPAAPTRPIGGIATWYGSLDFPVQAVAVRRAVAHWTRLRTKRWPQATRSGQENSFESHVVVDGYPGTS